MNQSLQSKKRGQIAIVDDDDAVCRSLSLLLRSKGFEVSVFDSGLAFLQRREPRAFDCILIDFKMSPRDGIALLRELRDLGDTVPAIMITGWESRDLAEDASAAGFEKLIYKPMLDDTLIAALDQVLAA